MTGPEAAAVTEPDPRPEVVERARIIGLVAILVVAAGVCVASTNGLLG